MTVSNNVSKSASNLRISSVAGLIVGMVALGGCTMMPAGLGGTAGGDAGANVSATVAPPAPATPLGGDPKERLLSAIEDEGCELNATTASAILANANLTQADVGDLTRQLAAEGRAEVSGEGAIRVMTSECI